MPEQLNITNLPSSRVEFIDPRTGLMSREWYRFFLNLFNLTGGGNNQTSLDDLQLSPPSFPSSGSGTVTSIDVTGGTTGLTTSGGPVTTSGTIIFAGTLNIANGGTGQITASAAFNALSPVTTLGDLIYGSATNTNARLAGNTTATKNFLVQTGTGTLSAAPSWGTIDVADVPTLNQNTTGTASNVTGIVAVANGGTGTATPALVAGTNVTITGTWPNQTINSSNPGGTVTSVAATVPAFLSVTGSPITSSGTLAISYSGTALPIANGGTGQTTASAAFNALSPITSTGDLIIGNGTNSATRLAIGANTYVLTSNGTTATWAVASGSGATITNDVATSTNVYPLFAAATSGSLTTAYTSNANYLYKPSTGELTALAHVSNNGIQINANTVATSYTIATGNNGLSAGPVTVNSGISVTVSSGSNWVVV
jgi:hypothetical protein